MAKKKIKVPMVIDARGRYCVYGYTAQEKSRDWDWGMVEEVADTDEPLENPQRYFVTIEVDLPADKETVGSVEAA